MSTFKVAVEQISSVRHHPNADRLDIAELVGMAYQFVVGRDAYKAGDYVVYFPLDAILPAALTDKLGLTGKLSGKARDRVKTIKLRGEISQGLVGPLSLLDDAIFDGEPPSTAYHDTDGRPLDFAAALGVTKYEPPEPGQPGATPVDPLPEGVHHYDIESCDRYKNVVDRLMGMEVVVFEKLEGSNTAVTRYPDGRIVVCSRNHALPTPSEEGGLLACRWHNGCNNVGLFQKVQEIAAEFPGQQVTVRGELVGPGVQGNIYKLDRHMVLAFEIEVGGRPLAAAEFLGCSGRHCLQMAPVLHYGNLREWLGDQTVRQRSTGPSVLRRDTLREGIVIRPGLAEDDEAHIRGLGRPILKQRSPEYLANES